MENILILSSPYLLDSIVPTILETNIVNEQSVTFVLLLSEQYSGQPSETVRIYNDIEDAIMIANSVIIINDGYFSYEVVDKMKCYFVDHKKSFKLIELNYPDNVLPFNNLKVEQLNNFDNVKPTILLLNIMNPSQLLKAELMITSELLNRDVKTCVVSNSHIYCRKSKKVPIKSFSCNKSSSNLMAFIDSCSLLHDCEEYTCSDIILASIDIELNKIENYSTYLLSCIIDALKADYVICCTPNNSDLEYLREVIYHKFLLNIDNFYLSDYIIIDNKYLKVTSCNNDDILKRISLLCDDIIMKLTLV